MTSTVAVARRHAALIVAALALLAPAPVLAAPGPASTTEQGGRAGRLLSPTMNHAAVEARSVVSAGVGKLKNTRWRVEVPAVVASILLALGSLLLGPAQSIASSRPRIRLGCTWLSRAPPASLQPA